MKIDEQGLLQAWPFCYPIHDAPPRFAGFVQVQEKGEGGEGRGGGGAAAMPLPGSLILYLQEKEEEGEAWYAPSLVLWFLYMQEKEEEEGGCDAPPLLCSLGSCGVLLTFLVARIEQNTRVLAGLSPLILPL